MRVDILDKPIHSSFLSSQKDTEKILKALFVDSKPYSDLLKRLLLINNPDCLDKDSENNDAYQTFIKGKSIGNLINEGYIRLNPKIKRPQHENIKSYILISFDNFTPSKNPQYFDCDVVFDVICYLDEWCLDNYQIRPLKICGYIDGILNSVTEKNKANFNKNSGNIRLSGIGEYKFVKCSETILDEDLAMYSLIYRGTHFSEDKEELTINNE